MSNERGGDVYSNHAMPRGLLPTGACSECGNVTTCKAPCLNTADSPED